MPWYSFQLTSEQQSQGVGMRALERFVEFHTRLGGPLDMAMFVARATYYLSPATGMRAPALLHLLGAAPSETPPHDAVLVGGHHEIKTKDLR
jgi:hypothetical protein